MAPAVGWVVCVRTAHVALGRIGLLLGAARLATLAQMRMAESECEGHVVGLAISQREAAANIGVSRQTPNAALQQLESEGLVKVGFRRLRIPDPARLA